MTYIRSRSVPERVVVNGILLAVVAAIAVPYVYTISASFQTQTELYSLPVHILPLQPTLDNYRQLFSAAPFIQWTLNSVIVTIMQTALAFVVSATAAYALAHHEFFGKQIVFLIVLGCLTLPVAILLVPLFVELIHLHLLNTLPGVFLPFAFSGYGIFLLRQYMLGVPKELLEAARADGAPEWRVFWSIVLPAIRPAIAVFTVFFFNLSWNNFVWPLLVLSQTRLFTLPVGLASLLTPDHPQIALVLTGSLLGTLPTIIVFFLLQRQFIEGLTAGALRG